MKYIIKNIISDIYWSAYGICYHDSMLPSKVKSILFVCKGNICRSPFAEIISKNNIDISNKYEFLSAGIQVESPQPPPVDAVIAANVFGVDMKFYKSKSINYRMIESTDLIVAMEVWQYRYLNKLFVEFKEKIFLLPVFDNNTKRMDKYSIYNIKDPYGKSQKDYNACFSRIKCCIEGLVKDIESNGESKSNQ